MISGSTLVLLHPLRHRVAHDECHLGRPETGEFVALPTIAIEVVELFDGRRSVGEVEQELAARHGLDVDVVEFVTELADVGFVARIDDVPVAGDQPPRGSLPWITPARSRWSLSGVTAAVVGAFLVSGLVLLVVGAARVPTWDVLLWSHHVGLVLVGNAVVAWLLVLVHELAHLVTARAAGAPARLSLGTRLQFLVAQTDVSGIRAEPLRVRLTVYLAGMAVNLAISAGALWVQVLAPPGGLVERGAAVVGLVSALMLAPQFLVFMRTDMYFVLSDTLGVSNLYGDAAALAIDTVGRLTGRPPASRRSTTGRQRLAVSCYGIVLALGSAACLGFFVLVSLPFTVGLLTGAAAELRSSDPVQIADAAATVTYLALLAALWCRAWWRRHGNKLSRKYRDGNNQQLEVP